MGWEVFVGYVKERPVAYLDSQNFLKDYVCDFDD